jgi:hypothetical protein
MRLTLKKEQYHLQSYRVLLRNLNQKKIPHPPFHMEKVSHGKGRWGKNLKTIINKGIANTNLLKKIHPSFQIERMGGQ